MTGITPSAKLSPSAQEFQRKNDVADLTRELFRLCGRKILQELREAETTDKLGRVPYEPRDDAPPGSRNGYKTHKFGRRKESSR